MGSAGQTRNAMNESSILDRIESAKNGFIAKTGEYPTHLILGYYEFREFDRALDLFRHYFRDFNLDTLSQNVQNYMGMQVEQKQTPGILVGIMVDPSRIA
jgi:hypothetical protein